MSITSSGCPQCCLGVGVVRVDDSQPVRKKWPFAGDTQLQRARRWALAYRQQLRRADPQACDMLDNLARSYGDSWVCGRLVTVDDEALLTTAEAAEFAEVTVETIRKWRTRGVRTPSGGRMYLAVKGLNERGWPVFRAGDIRVMANMARQSRLVRK